MSYNDFGWITRFFADSMVFPYFFIFFCLLSDIKGYDIKEKIGKDEIGCTISHVYPSIMCDTHKQHQERKIQCCKHLGRLVKY